MQSSLLCDGLIATYTPVKVENICRQPLGTKILKSMLWFKGMLTDFGSELAAVRICGTIAKLIFTQTLRF